MGRLTSTLCGSVYETFLCRKMWPHSVQSSRELIYWRHVGGINRQLNCSQCEYGSIVDHLIDGGLIENLLLSEHPDREGRGSSLRTLEVFPRDFEEESSGLVYCNSGLVQLELGLGSEPTFIDIHGESTAVSPIFEEDAASEKILRGVIDIRFLLPQQS